MLRSVSFSIIILLLLTVEPYSQPRRTPEERAKLLKTQLNLSDEQTSKVTEIYVNSDKKIKEAFQENMDRTKFRAIMDTTHLEVEKILTDKQKAAYKKIVEERRSRSRGNNFN